MPTNPVDAAWAFVARHRDTIARYSARWHGHHDREQFESDLLVDVFDAHARGIYRPDGCAPTSWIYTRARLIRTESDRRERRRRMHISIDTAEPAGDVVGLVLPAAPSSWGSAEAAEARASLRILADRGVDITRQEGS